MERLCKSSLNGQEKGTRCHRDGAARDRNGTDGLVLSDSAHDETAWAPYFKPLPQCDLLPGVGESMLHEPGDRAACSGSGGWVFTGVELHTRAPDVCFASRVWGLGRNAVEPARSFRGEPGGRFALRDREALEGFELERDDAERIAGGDGLWRRVFEQVGWLKAEDVRDFGAVMQSAELGVLLPHGGEDAAVGVGIWFDLDGDGADVEQELEFSLAAQRRVVEVQPARRAERGMAGERKLFLGGEDADADAFG